MDIRAQLEAFWSGERPDQIPYTIYQNEWRHTADDPAWQPMFEAGLGVTWYVPTYHVKLRNVEIVDTHYVEDGTQMHRQVQRTAVGEIAATWAEGWHRKYFLETAEDYRVMTYIVEQAEITPAHESYLACEAGLPPYAVAIPVVGRTPLQTILVDYAGLEKFGWHLFEYEEEVRRLYDALLDNFRCIVEITATGPGRYVSNLENFTAETLGPRRYEEFLLPVYEECFAMLHEADKIVGCHYDGRTVSCREQIARAPIDLIESLTPPPEGDQTLAEARAAWPDKLLWSNINVACYELPPEQLKALVLGRVEEAALDGRKLAFEVSEQYPANWRESVPVVLEALKETRV
jgi:nitrogen regulatory protein PII-like uncharacterized protein